MSDLLQRQLEDAATHVPQLGDIDKAITTGVQRRNRTRAVSAVVGMACAAILAAVIWSAGPGGSEPEPLESPTPTPTQSVVHGWPGTSRNAAGVYSFDGYRCGSGRPKGSCDSGHFMHNGYGSGDVLMRLLVKDRGASNQAEAGSESAGDRVAALVAGHEAIYQRLDERHERWIVDIEGTTIVIRLDAERGTSRADMSDAHAIIDSMHTEPSERKLGFKVVFTLTNNDWDSG